MVRLSEKKTNIVKDESDKEYIKIADCILISSYIDGSNHGSTYIERGDKIIDSYESSKTLSGDFKGRKVLAFSNHILKMNIDEESDKLLALQVNKSHIKRNDINAELNRVVIELTKDFSTKLYNKFYKNKDNDSNSDSVNTVVVTERKPKKAKKSAVVAVASDLVPSQAQAQAQAEVSVVAVASDVVPSQAQAQAQAEVSVVAVTSDVAVSSVSSDVADVSDVVPSQAEVSLVAASLDKSKLQQSKLNFVLNDIPDESIKYESINDTLVISDSKNIIATIKCFSSPEFMKREYIGLKSKVTFNQFCKILKEEEKSRNDWL